MMPVTIKIIGQEKRIGFNAGSIHPKLKERNSNPAITSSNPNKMPFDFAEKEEHALVSIICTFFKFAKIYG